MSPPGTSTRLAETEVVFVHRLLRECGLGWTPGDVTRLGRGRASDAWRFTAHGRPFLLRVPTRRTGPEFFAAHLGAHALCAAAGVGVPQVVAAQPSSAVAGRPFMVLTWVEGTDFDDLLDGDPARAHTPAAAPTPATSPVWRAGAALGRLHAVAGEGFDLFLLGDGDGRSWADVCRWRLHDVLSEPALRAVLGAERAGAAGRLAERLPGLLPPHLAPRLTHGDCHYPNMVVGPGGEVTLLDLEHARFYDPLWDFCKLDAWSLRRHPGTVEDLVAGYTSQGHDDPRAQPRLRLYQLVEYLHGLRYFALRYPDAGMARLTLALLDRLLAGEEGFLGARLEGSRAGR